MSLADKESLINQGQCSWKTLPGPRRKWPTLLTLQAHRLLAASITRFLLWFFSAHGACCWIRCWTSRRLGCRCLWSPRSWKMEGVTTRLIILLHSCCTNRAFLSACHICKVCDICPYMHRAGPALFRHLECASFLPTRASCRASCRSRCRQRSSSCFREQRRQRDPCWWRTQRCWRGWDRHCKVRRDYLQGSDVADEATHAGRTNRKDGDSLSLTGRWAGGFEAVEEWCVLLLNCRLGRRWWTRRIWKGRISRHFVMMFAIVSIICGFLCDHGARVSFNRKRGDRGSITCEVAGECGATSSPHFLCAGK